MSRRPSFPSVLRRLAVALLIAGASAASGLAAPADGAPASPAAKPPGGDPNFVTLLEGEEKTVSLDGPADRITIDRSGIVSLFLPTRTSLSLTGVASGLTTIKIRSESGVMRSLIVRVRAASSTALDAVASELRGYFRDMPSVSVDVREDKILVSGTIAPSLESYYRSTLSNYSDLVVDLVTVVQSPSGIVTVGPDGNPLVIDTVRIDVQVVEVDRDDSKDLGVEWFANGPWQASASAGVNGDLSAQGALTGTRGQEVNQPTTVINTGGGQVASAGAQNGSLGQGNGIDYDWGATGQASIQNVNFNLIALAKKGKAKFLATPKLLVESGKKAKFLVGGEIPYTSTSTLGSSNVEFKKYGTQLEIAPEVRSDSAVFVNVTAIVSEPDFTNSVQGEPAMKTKETTTNVTLRQGRCFAIAGLLSQDRGKNISKVPFFGDLPLLGYLFKRQTDTIKDAETIVFITPYLVHENGKGTPANALPVSPAVRSFQKEAADTGPDAPSDPAPKATAAGAAKP